jgi:hypothetical protein
MEKPAADHMTVTSQMKAVTFPAPEGTTDLITKATMTTTGAQTTTRTGRMILVRTLATAIQVIISRSGMNRMWAATACTGMTAEKFATFILVDW